ncbi:uncharacterized protein LOC123259367 [Cotesia glomerata]|uniref:Gustatory receptor n=1 Tax=Cotesia glomerata TaxID=32391 RepID=A0AAV7I1S0_COTGL|nr:uncharacterized protein LOC123259367 [Cotesia glomerata]KAH0540341.1 hypothetical protein KQX54_016457 [Cotesia glomerata]
MDSMYAMDRTIKFGYNKYLWMKFFVVKIFEYIMLWSMIGIHLYSSAYGDDFSWVFLIVGTEIGFCIIISVLLFGGLFKTRVHRKIHGLLNLIGCVLFIISGVRIIYVYKVQSNNFQDNFVNYWPSLDFLHSINSKKYEAAINNFKIILPSAIDDNNVKNQIRQIFVFGFARGVLSIILGILLLLDSFLAFKEIY